MLIVDKGVVQNPKVHLTHKLILDKSTNTYPERDSISPGITGGLMNFVSGIVVHQTGAEKASSTLNSYTNKGANGAHFLIDKDGEIYQTVPLNRRANHVGPLRSRCLLMQNCPASEIKQLKAWHDNPSSKGKAGTNKREMALENCQKRFPSNEDSIGIELVGMHYKYDKNNSKKQHPVFKESEVYEPLTKEQHESLYWLLTQLAATFDVPFTEIFRHPEVAFKNKTEARSAQEELDRLLREQEEAANQQKEAPEQ